MHEISRDFPHAVTPADFDGSNLAAHLRAIISRTMAGRQTRRVVEGLSDAQLKDSGIDRAMVLGNRPSMEFDARLATYLASLR